MNIYIWCVVGAIAGAVAVVLMGKPTKIVMIENVLVAVFGAVLGGEVIGNVLAGPLNEKDFSMRSLGMAVAGAVLFLVVLRVMRKAVGPMRPSKKKVATRI